MDDRDTFCRDSLTNWASDAAGASALAPTSAAAAATAAVAGNEAMLSLLDDGRTSRMLSGLWDADEDESCTCNLQNSEEVTNLQFLAGKMMP